MNYFADAFAWLTSPDRLTGPNPLPAAFAEHLWYTFISVLIATAIAVPVGYLIGHTGKGRNLAVMIAGAGRAVPSFGLMLLLVLVFGVLHKPAAAVTAFVLLAIPSILAGAYSGIEAIDRAVVEAGRGMGMTPWQVFRKVELPLSLPLLIGGLRAATLQVVATVALAAYIGLGGLGYYIIQGVPLRRFDQILGGAIAIVILALALDALFAVLERLAVPRGVRAGQHQQHRTVATRRRAAVSTTA